MATTPPVLKRWLIRLTLGLLALTALFVLGLLSMRWVPPLTTAFMVRERIQTGPIDYRWTPAEEISDEAAIAVVASEDQKFPNHVGFDLDAIEDALEGPGPPSRGASTISQQVAKNLYLWPEGGYVRKGIEAGITLGIEALWTKERILEVYLNIAELGPGVFGVEAASQRYFGKPASKLTRSEAALLAAALPNPKTRRVEAPSSSMRSRQRHIERQIRNLGGPGYLIEAGVWQ